MATAKKMPAKKMPFEMSKKDKEPKGGPKEGSRREEMMDRRQMMGAGYKKGGKVKC